MERTGSLFALAMTPWSEMGIMVQITLLAPRVRKCTSPNPLGYQAPKCEVLWPRHGDGQPYQWNGASSLEDSLEVRWNCDGPSCANGKKMRRVHIAQMATPSHGYPKSSQGYGLRGDPPWRGAFIDIKKDACHPLAWSLTLILWGIEPGSSAQGSVD